MFDRYATGIEALFQMLLEDLVPTEGREIYGTFVSSQCFASC